MGSDVFCPSTVKSHNSFTQNWTETTNQHFKSLVHTLAHKWSQSTALQVVWKLSFCPSTLMENMKRLSSRNQKPQGPQVAPSVELLHQSCPRMNPSIHSESLKLPVSDSHAPSRHTLYQSISNWATSTATSCIQARELQDRLCSEW
jgi:hypothetical protein